MYLILCASAPSWAVRRLWTCSIDRSAQAGAVLPLAGYADEIIPVGKSWLMCYEVLEVSVRSEHLWNAGCC